MDKFKKINETICILINLQGNIYYSNKDKSIAKKFIEYINIFEYLHINKKVSFDIEHYSVTLDKLELDKAVYFLILIQPERILYRNAYIDLMTGLYNRNFWEHICKGEIYNLGVKDFSVVLIDVDNLKKLNDTYGHLIGDKVIKIVGQSVIKSIRKEDLGIRYGGDEFIVLLFNQDEKASSNVIKRIKKEINRRTIVENIDIEVSTGVCSGNCLIDVEEMIKMADKDLYLEKGIKKEQQERINPLKDLCIEIRKELNDKIYDGDKIIVNEGIMKLCSKLDELITKYLK